MTSTLPQINSPPSPRHEGGSSARFGQGSPMVSNGVCIGLGTVGLGERCQSERERARREHYKQWKREKAYTSPLRSSTRDNESTKSPRSTKEMYQEKKAKHQEIMEKRQMQDERRMLKSREESNRWKADLRASKEEEKEFTATFTQMCRELANKEATNPQAHSTANKQLKADAAAAVAMLNNEQQQQTGGGSVQASSAPQGEGALMVPVPPSTAPNNSMQSPNRSQRGNYHISLGFQSSYRSTAGSANSPLTPRQQSVREEVELQQLINESVRNVDEDVRQQRIQQTHPVIAAQMQHAHVARNESAEDKKDEVHVIRDTMLQYKKQKHLQDVDREKDYTQIAKDQRTNQIMHLDEEKNKLLEDRMRAAEKIRDQRPPARTDSTPTHAGGASSTRSPSPRREATQVLEHRAAAAAVVRQQREQLKTAREADQQAEKDRNVRLYQEARNIKMEQKRAKEAAATTTHYEQAPAAPVAEEHDH